MRMKRRPDATPIGYKRDELGRFVKTQKIETEEDFTEWSFWTEVATEVAKDEAQGCTSQVHRGREDQIW